MRRVKPNLADINADYFVLWVRTLVWTSFGQFHNPPAHLGGAGSKKERIWAASRRRKSRRCPGGVVCAQNLKCHYVKPWMEKKHEQKACHFINKSLGARFLVWVGCWLIVKTGRRSCPCVQSNPHQGQLLQSLPLELLNQQKLWRNLTLTNETQW